MIPRHLAAVLQQRYETARSVYLFGPRQSGKTTLARYAFPELPYISLEDPDVLLHAQTDPRGFLAQMPEGGIIDEPQRYPDLFSYLQGEIDNAHKKYVLTSSQNFLMMASISQSLAGRISLLSLYPLTHAEIRQVRPAQLSQMLVVQDDLSDSITTRFEAIISGGYPEVISKPASQAYWHSDYVMTYLEKDVRRIVNVKEVGHFQRFLKLCAGRTGQLLSKASLAADCGISESTCARWLSILVQSGIVLLIQPFYQNFSKRLVKSPKLHFVDTGLCCHLLGIKNKTHLETHPLLGHIIESYVVSELYKSVSNQGQQPAFYHWRDQHGHEIDLLIEQENGVLLPIEIKLGQTFSPQMCKSLQKWQAISGVEVGYVLYGGEKGHFVHGVNVIPIAQVI